MTPAAVLEAAQEVTQDPEKRVEIKVPSNARPRTFADLLRRELYKIYGAGMVGISHEKRERKKKVENWLHVIKPN